MEHPEKNLSPGFQPLVLAELQASHVGNLLYRQAKLLPTGSQHLSVVQEADVLPVPALWKLVRNECIITLLGHASSPQITQIGDE